MKNILLITLLLLPAALVASFKPAKLFTDNMVLQRQRPIHIWGSDAAPGSSVSASFAGNTASSTASENGDWLLTLPAIPNPVTTPLTLTLQNGQDIITLSNLLVGDVWICAGQSNMSLTVAHNANINPDQPWSVKQDSGYRLPDFNPEVDSLIRNFGIEKVIPDDYDTPQPDFPEGRDGDPYAEGIWKVTTSESAAEFSATGFYFARAYREGKLRSGENIPVGLIMTAWGGTPIESWMSMPLLRSRPDFAERLAEITPSELPSKGRANLPSSGYNSRVHPLRNFGVRGVIWHQGESNSGATALYQAQLPAMAEVWRTQFENPELPFLIIELSPIGRSAKSGEAQNRSWMREAQGLISENSPNMYLVSALDVGNYSPIPGNSDMEVHSRDKHLLGPRAALIARQHIDGEAIQSSGPKPLAVTTRPNGLTISYDQAIATPDRENIRGFDVAAEDGVYIRPDSFTIEGNQLHISTSLPNPVSVRYGWSNPAHALSEKSAFDADEYPPPANLVAANATDGIHLPALPFRYETKLVGNTLSRSLDLSNLLGDWDSQVYERTRAIIKTDAGLQRTRAVATETITYRSDRPITDFTLTLQAVKKTSYAPVNPARRIFVAASNDGIRWTAPTALSITNEAIDRTTEKLIARPALGILKTRPSFLRIIIPGYLTESSTVLQSVEIKNDPSAEPADYPAFPTDENTDSPAAAIITATASSDKFARPGNREPISLSATVNPLAYSASAPAVPETTVASTTTAATPLKESFDDFSKVLAKSNAVQIRKSKPIGGDSYRASLASGDDLTLKYQGKTIPGALLYSINGNTRLTLTVFHYGAKARDRIQVRVSNDGSSWQSLRLSADTSRVSDAKGWSRTVYRSKDNALKGNSLLLLQIEAVNPLWALQLSSIVLE